MGMDVDEKYARQAQQCFLYFLCAFLCIASNCKLETRVAIRLAAAAYLTHSLILLISSIPLVFYFVFFAGSTSLASFGTCSRNFTPENMDEASPSASIRSARRTM